MIEKASGFHDYLTLAYTTEKDRRKDDVLSTLVKKQKVYKEVELIHEKKHMIRGEIQS